jgi:carbon-monoxide dehydrogenase medium subunit
LLANGHSLIPAMKLRLATPKYLIDLGTVPELRGVRLEGDSLAIGALTVHADVASSDLVRQRLPGLARRRSLATSGPIAAPSAAVSRTMIRRPTFP